MTLWCGLERLRSNVPAVSTWGRAVLASLVKTVGSVLIGGRRRDLTHRESQELGIGKRVDRVIGRRSAPRESLTPERETRTLRHTRSRYDRLAVR